MREGDFIFSWWFSGAIFVGIFILGIVIGNGIAVTDPDFLITNQTAHDVVSISTQILATILAIVISLTILAVEMTSSKYSPRVIEIFKKNTFMIFFIFSYLFLISGGLIFLTFSDNPNFLISRTNGTLFLLITGILLLLMLIPYIFTTFEFLNAERIVKRLANLIDIKTINPQTDPFQSLFDVIYGAIRINDFTTMSTGLVSAEDRFKEIIGKDREYRQMDYVAFRFFDDLKRCGFLLIEKKEEKYAFEIITRLNTISHWAFEEQNTLVLHQACTAIEEIGIKGCEFRQSSVVNHTLTTLKEIIEKIENIEGLPTEEPKIQKWSCVLFSFVEATSNIGKTAVRSNLTASSGNAINILNTIGRIAIDRNLSFDDDFIFKRISVIIIESMQRKNTLLTRSLIDVMQYLGSYSLSQNRIRETKRILLELKNIGKYAANQEEGQTLLKIVNSIRYIAITAIEKGITDVGSDAVRCSVKFQMIFPKFFKNQREVSFYDYPCSPSTSTTAEDFDIAMEYEYMLLDEYLHPPEYYAEDYDDGSMVISL